MPGFYYCINTRKPSGLWVLLFAAAMACMPPAQGAEHEDLIAYVTGDAASAKVVVDSPGTFGNAPQDMGACAPAAQPAWSMDGALLVFEAPRADGPGTVIAWRLVDGAGPDSGGTCGGRFLHNRNASTSPDGRYVAYEGYDTLPQDSSIVVFDRGTGEETVWGSERKAMFGPQWLPNPKLLLSIDPNREITLPGVDIDAVRAESGLADGSAISGGPTKALFAVGMDVRDGLLTSEILLVTQTQTLPILALVPDGPDSTRYCEWNPRVSPGGTRVVFESDYGGDREIYQLDQYGLLNLTNDAAADWNPVWAKNGKWIAYESLGATAGIQRLMVDTLRKESVVEGAHATWSPDGARLAYVKLLEGKPAVFIHPVSGGGEDGVQNAWAPAWRPKP